MRRRLLRSGCVCAVMGVLLGIRPATAQEKGGPLIVPGKSVDEIRLGTEDPEIQRQLGESSTGDSAAGTHWGAWFGKKEGGGRGPELDIKSTHSAGHDKDAAAVAIRVESPFFHVKEGISTRSSLAEIWQVFPGLRYSDTDRDDAAVERYGDNGRGIGIEVRRTWTSGNSLIPPDGVWGVCQALVVFTPDKDGTGPMPNIRSMRDTPDR